MMSESRTKIVKVADGQPVSLGGKSILRLHELYVCAVAANKAAQAAQAAYAEELNRVGELLAPEVPIERLLVDFLAHTLSVRLEEPAPATTADAGT